MSAKCIRCKADKTKSILGSSLLCPDCQEIFDEKIFYPFQRKLRRLKINHNRNVEDICNKYNMKVKTFYQGEEDKR